MRIKWTIRNKLIAVLTACTLLFMAVFSALISYVSYNAYKSQANEQQARLVGAVKKSAAIAAFVGNEEIANEVLSGLLQDDEILSARLRGQKEFQVQANSEGQLTELLSRNASSVYPLLSPVDNRSIIGEIRIWANEPLITQRANDLVMDDIWKLVGLSFTLALASMLAVNSMVVSPLRNLAEQLAQTTPGAGQLTQVSPLHRNDEIGLVSNSANLFIKVTQEALDSEREIQEKLTRMNRHFNSVFSSSHVGIAILDEQGRMLHHNPVLTERLVKLNEHELESLSSQDFFNMVFSEPEEVWNLVDSARTDNESASADLALSRSWKQPCWVHCLLNVNQDEANNSEIIEVVLYDVTVRVQEAAQAKKLAEQDALTGLLNRRGCEHFLHQRFRRQEAKQSLVVMLLDLDGFKPINDTHGHDGGDIALQTIGQRLTGMVRGSTDAVGRIGGDEFLVILRIKQNPQKKAEEIAAAIIRKVSEPINIDSTKTAQLGVSIGIAYAKHYDNLDALIKAADTAMYQVKAKGKNAFASAEL